MHEYLIHAPSSIAENHINATNVSTDARPTRDPRQMTRLIPNEKYRGYDLPANKIDTTQQAFLIIHDIIAKIETMLNFTHGPGRPSLIWEEQKKECEAIKKKLQQPSVDLKAVHEQLVKISTNVFHLIEAVC